MSDFPATKRLMEEVVPNLTEEGQSKVKDLMREYGIRQRELTAQEVEVAGSILFKLVTKYTK